MSSSKRIKCVAHGWINLFDALLHLPLPSTFMRSQQHTCIAIFKPTLNPQDAASQHLCFALNSLHIDSQRNKMKHHVQFEVVSDSISSGPDRLQLT
eukprot:2498850-Amphidinium_carterae.1